MTESIFESFDENSNVLVFEYISSTPHFETSVEIALRLSERLSRVTFCHLGITLPAEDFRRNVFGLKTSTLRKLDVRPRTGRNLDSIAGLVEKELPELGSRITWNFPKFLEPGPQKAEIPAEFLGSLAKLVSFSHEDLPLGVGLANSLAAHLGRIDAIPAHHVRLLRKIFDSQLTATAFLKNLLGNGGFTDIVVFNGRFAVGQGAVETARRFRVNIWRHEMGANDLAGYRLSPFATHDPRKVGRAALKKWNDSSVSRAEKAEIVRRSPNYRIQLRDQVRATIVAPSRYENLKSRAFEGPERSSQRDIVTFFTSTEGEFELLGPLTPQSLFKSQRDAAINLKKIAEDAGMRLVIRVHPNVRNHSSGERNWWKEFAKEHGGENCIVYGENSKADSYELINMSKLVIIWHSTIGLEAVYRSVPCCCLSENPYISAGAEVHQPKSLDDLYQMIAAPPVVKNPYSVMPWIYSMEVSQEKFIWFAPLGRHRGHFFGKKFR